jgi:hypothetical protein
MLERLRSYIDFQVTLGDLLAVTSPIALAAIAAMIRFWKRRHPFSFLFPDQPIDIALEDELRGRTYHRAKTLPHGHSTILIELRTRIPTNATPFDIRFVELRWFRSRSVSPQKIRVRTISIPRWTAEAVMERDATGPNVPEMTFNSVGGVAVATRIPKHWVAGERLMVELGVEANCTWRGYLSFRANADGRRCFCRRRVEVIGYLPTCDGTA